MTSKPKAQRAGHKGLVALAAAALSAPVATIPLDHAEGHASGDVSETAVRTAQAQGSKLAVSQSKPNAPKIKPVAPRIKLKPVAPRIKLKPPAARKAIGPPCTPEEQEAIEAAPDTLRDNRQAIIGPHLGEGRRAVVPPLERKPKKPQ